jgi:hypothetical protein
LKGILDLGQKGSLPISCHAIEGVPLRGMFEVFCDILSSNRSEYVVVNVGPAGKHLACAAISASFVNGFGGRKSTINGFGDPCRR